MSEDMGELEKIHNVNKEKNVSGYLSIYFSRYQLVSF
jgi:hypothetical protein